MRYLDEVVDEQEEEVRTRKAGTGSKSRPKRAPQSPIGRKVSALQGSFYPGMKPEECGSEFYNTIINGVITREYTNGIYLHVILWNDPNGTKTQNDIPYSEETTKPLLTAHYTRLFDTN